ncbi:sulfatase [Planctomicrobium sp. SH661]|uniref:sulfatase n=1 Tax=Planctomicrobium sp. SH661 TaxID=3448124 RepID=UPI003F5AFDE2
MLSGFLSTHSLAAADLPDTSGMNVLFINIEDCNAGTWGCYGNSICRTPNLDRFAESAVRFDSAYCQAVSCNPSRTSFLTGLRPGTTKVFTNQDVMDEVLPAEIPTLPEFMKGGGFTTAQIGKLFHTTDYAEDRIRTFDRIEHTERPEGWNGPAPVLTFPPVPNVDGRPDKPRLDPEYVTWKRKNSDRYGASGLSREEEIDYRMAATAVELLKQYSRDKTRFFMTLSQSRPHTPLVVPEEYVRRYDPDQIPTPPAPPESFRNLPQHYVARSQGVNPDIHRERQPTAAETRATIAAYYACVSFIDENLGLVFDALDRTGLSENTIVIVFSDHGFHLGDHGFWSKYTMLEPTRRVPLVVRVPGAAGNGVVSHQFVELVDLFPTIAELAKLSPPGNLEGTSFVPLLADPEREWKSAVFMSGGSRDRGEMVRDREYSYIEYSGEFSGTALFDLKNDPWETKNLADDPDHAAAQTTMAAKLHRGWKSALPENSSR